MEGTQSEEIFDSLNLNPQLFINEILNSVDNMVDGAFEFYEQKALTILGDIDKNKSDDLIKGISSIRNKIQEVLDKRMGMWEKYSLQHCFVVPEGFSLQQADMSGDVDQDTPSDAELDNQLDSLREKLYMAGKESAVLQTELHGLKHQSTISNSCAKSVAEALQLCQQKSVHDMFQEMVSTAAELQTKMEKLKIKRMVEFGRDRTEKIYGLNTTQSMIHQSNGLSAVDLKDLQEFVADLQNLFKDRNQYRDHVYLRANDNSY